VDKEPPGERLSRFIREDLMPDWRPSRDQWLWALRIVLILAVLLGILTLIGLPFDITLWNWLDLLIIPVVLAIGGYLFTRSENRATQAAAERRAQDEALQAYLDQMSNMLIPNEGQLSLYEARPGDSLSSVARARTLTVLPRLDSQRKAHVVQFLYESGLIARDHPILDLSAADLSGANLRRGRLARANLSYANLSGADLSRVANLSYANLSYANLSGADLSMMSNLSGACLIGADLSSANLSYANLAGATITQPPYEEMTDEFITADLTEANLHGTNLSGADLSGATGWTEEQLTAAYLGDAIMPNGQKYEVWLKRKGRGEDGEGSGPS